MKRARGLNTVVSATAIAILTASAAHAITVRGTPVTVMNSEDPVPVAGKVTVTNTVPVSGSVGITGSVNIGNTPTVNVGNSPTVVIDNASPVTVKVSDHSVVPINVSFTGTNQSWIAADISLPASGILESIAVRCRYPSGIQTAGVITQSSTFPQGVTVSSVFTSMAPALVLGSNLVWPLSAHDYERILPVTQVGLPVPNKFSFWVGGNSTQDPINCVGTAVVRYQQ